ncbi:M23 family metallopeptidase [Paenibacillus sp. sptzw28]|uniref:M23 family metallopeptidase n=1 Tax=Paenibacillus sp. sptzw28 TaxID=715179 RepID=UPI001C6F0FA9|nr:M23 family metallopeptidase [Paenibacillus sp. sptzw28]QYR21271.1 M23 family metallopeptidase [Paenibacillus sp. sptzw28]
MIKDVVIHPIFNHAYSCSEHPEGQLATLGDALGVDCVIHKFVDGWMRTYKGNGLNNEDWYVWGADVLAPFDGIVEEVYINNNINNPGNVNPSRASMILFSTADGIKVCYAHVMDVCVGIGDHVKAGQVVAKVGNNGYSRHPHIHIGAWEGDTPLQIRFDLQAMGKQYRELGVEHYSM